MWQKARDHPVVTVFLMLATAFLVSFLTLYILFSPPDLDRIRDPRKTSIVFDETEKRIREYCTYCREPIALAAMGKKFPDFAIAVEDKRFRNRFIPYDPLGVVGAFIQFYRTGKIRGASGIEQQLSRIIYLQEEVKRRGFWPQVARKIREAWIAAWIFVYLPEDEILEAYLNHIPCDQSRYGIKACSRIYFRKDPRELNPAEIALIIGLWRSHSSSPWRDPQKAKEVRSRVLGQLEREEKITSEERKTFEGYPIPVRIEGEHPEHFLEYIRRDITKTHRLVDTGLQIFSTLNSELQNVVSRALRHSMEKMKEQDPELEDLRGLAMVTECTTGKIRAFAQEPAFRENQYLINQMEQRQLGSVAKIFYMGAALEKGRRLSCKDEGSGPCKLNDSPGISLSMGGGRGIHHIGNFNYARRPRYRGLIETILDFSESRNAGIMSDVQGTRGAGIQQLVTKEDILAFAAKLGVTPPTLDYEIAKKRGVIFIKRELAETLGLPLNTVDPGHTIAIGSMEGSPIEMLRVLASLDGEIVEPYAIEKIVDQHGKELSAHEREARSTPLDEKTRLSLIRALRSTVEYWYEGRRIGTASPLADLGVPAMGKTGTATDSNSETTDIWFVGRSPSLCFVGWIGRENKLPMKTTWRKAEWGEEKVQVTGGRYVLPIFEEVLMYWPVYEKEIKLFFPSNTDPNQPFQIPQEPEQTPESLAEDFSVN